MGEVFSIALCDVDSFNAAKTISTPPRSSRRYPARPCPSLRTDRFRFWRRCEIGDLFPSSPVYVVAVVAECVYAAFAQVPRCRIRRRPLGVTVIGVAGLVPWQRSDGRGIVAYANAAPYLRHGAGPNQVARYALVI